MGLDTVELVMAVEEGFRIEIANEEAEKILTVGDMHRVVCAKLGEECNKEEVWKKLHDIVVRHAGVKPEEVTLEASFVDDLRMD